MTWLRGLIGTRDSGGRSAVSDALAREAETQSELADVARELERLVRRLNEVPEVRAARENRRRRGDN